MKQQEDEEGSSNSNPNPNPNPNPNQNPCPICLGAFIEDAYLDRCFHKYCYKCIVRWTQVVSGRSSCGPPSSVKCPLCKTENFSIIYGYDGSTFQQHFINPNNGNSTFFSEAHKYRLQSYYIEPGLLRDTFKVERYWKSRKYLCHNNWLEKWLRRELQALRQEEDVEVVMHHILGIIESFSRRRDPKVVTHVPHLKQAEFKGLVADGARPFLMGRTHRFVDELELFLASGLTVEAYDGAYKTCLGWKKPGEISEDSKITSRERDPIAPSLCFSDDDCDEADWAENVHL